MLSVRIFFNSLLEKIDDFVLHPNHRRKQNGCVSVYHAGRVGVGVPMVVPRHLTFWMVIQLPKGKLGRPEAHDEHVPK